MFCSTTHDLLLWEQGPFGGKLLSRPSLDKMTTPSSAGYGFGLWIAPNRRVAARGGRTEQSALPLHSAPLGLHERARPAQGRGSRWHARKPGLLESRRQIEEAVNKAGDEER
jgi:hypothetical protein